VRNPIRLKNFAPRFFPYFIAGLAVVVFREPSPEGFVLGVPAIAAGAALRSWGAGHLVKNDVLTTTGPYAHLRHPLYLGTLLVATGFALLLGGIWTLAVLAAVWPWFAFHYFPRKDRIECARLAALHGEAFARYRAAVPALWPRLRPWRDVTHPGPRASDSSHSCWQLARYSDNNELGTVIAILAALLLFWGRSSWGGD
jgi:protein-S-isoprenylcysteine O-methyltransferase Ste14